MLIEEDTKIRGEYQPGSMYDWNFDGLTENQIFNAVQQMAIAVSSYKKKTRMNNNSGSHSSRIHREI